MESLPLVLRPVSILISSNIDEQSFHKARLRDMLRTCAVRDIQDEDADLS